MNTPLSAGYQSMPAAIITLTTDFGRGSPYVAAMKGVILSINPRGDDRRHLALDRAAEHCRRRVRAWPSQPLVSAETIHVAVVDPGVGTGAADCLRPHWRPAYLSLPTTDY